MSKAGNLLPLIPSLLLRDLSRQWGFVAASAAKQGMYYAARDAARSAATFFHASELVRGL